jgi:hypothetical protein
MSNSIFLLFSGDLKFKMTAPPAPIPKSLLGRHRLLSPTAGVLVSPLCLGAMNFGDAWKEFMGVSGPYMV